MAEEHGSTAAAVLRLASALVDGIQAVMAQQGFADVRPMHGFVFVRLAESPATGAQLAAFLGVTKQATSELVGQLVERGYLERHPDTRDRRSHVLVLTERGLACTRAAELGMARTVAGWKQQLTARQFATLVDALNVLTRDTQLRPAW